MYIRTINLKIDDEKGKKCIFGKYDDESAFTVLEFISSGQVQSKASMYRLVENFTGYSYFCQSVHLLV